MPFSKKTLSIAVAALIAIPAFVIIFVRSAKYKELANKKKMYMATSELNALNYGFIKESDISPEYIVKLLEKRNLANAHLLEEEKGLYKKTIVNGKVFIESEFPEGIYCILEGAILVKLKSKKGAYAELSPGDSIANPNSYQWEEVQPNS